MSILGGSSSSNNGPIFQEFKKQASFFFKEKIKTARLALTDVTPAQLYVFLYTIILILYLRSRRGPSLVAKTEVEVLCIIIDRDKYYSLDVSVSRLNNIMPCF